MCRSFCNSFTIWRHMNERRTKSSRRKNSLSMSCSAKNRRRKCCLLLKGNHRSGLRFISTIFPPGSDGRDSISKICSLSRRSAAKVTAAHYLLSWRRSHGIGAVAVWNERCSIGTNRQLSSIAPLAQSRCTSGQYFGWPAKRSGSWRVQPTRLPLERNSSETKRNSERKSEELKWPGNTRRLRITHF